MKKNTFFAVACAFMLLFSTSCSNDVVETDTPISKNETEAVAQLKSDLVNLNKSYVGNGQNTRIPKWLRWIITGVADVVGFVASGCDVGDAVAVSNAVWTYTKSEDKKAVSTAIKDVAQKMPVGSPGLTHNQATLNLFLNNGGSIAGLSVADIVEQSLDETTKLTGRQYYPKERARILSFTQSIIDRFDSNASVEENIEALKPLAEDQTQLETIELCGVLIEGLQYVDDDDTSYVENATKIINESDLSVEGKKMLLGSLSIAEGSAKLWNEAELE